jgi:hypothetical protein
MIRFVAVLVAQSQKVDEALLEDSAELGTVRLDLGSECDPLPKRRPGYVFVVTDPFVRPLAADARVLVELEGRPLVRYAVMLQLRIEGRWQTVRLLDNAHGDHDMHRYTGSKKQPAERFFDGSASEVAPQAIRYLIDHWEAIAESWKS